MIDVREQILLRIFAVLALVPGVQFTYRNRTEIAEGSKPCLILIDGDEISESRDNNKGGMTPRRVTMNPEIILLVSSNPDFIGSELNVFRASIIHILCSDNILKELTLHNDHVTYDGAQSILENGRRVEGAFLLSFSLSYLLRPADLAP